MTLIKNKIYEKLYYEEYLVGYSLGQVAKKAGITRQALFQAFKRKGYSMRGKNFIPPNVNKV